MVESIRDTSTYDRVNNTVEFRQIFQRLRKVREMILCNFAHLRRYWHSLEQNIANIYEYFSYYLNLLPSVGSFIFPDLPRRDRGMVSG